MSIRIELSPAPDDTEGWTMADWQKLADDFIRYFKANEGVSPTEFREK